VIWLKYHEIQIKKQTIYIILTDDNMKSNPNQHFVLIEDLASAGAGVCRIDGKVCFVPYSVTGDSLRIEIKSENRSFIRAQIVEILSPGPHRRQPPCTLFGQCGGCTWLHVDPIHQAHTKEKILRRALELKQVGFVRSPAMLGYRRVARLHLNPTTGSLGFKKQKGNEVVDVNTCPILAPRLNTAIAPVKNWLLNHMDAETEVRLVLGEGGIVAHVKSKTPLSPNFYQGGMALVPTHLNGLLVSVDGVLATVAGDGSIGAPGIDESLLTMPASSFGQANWDTNQLLGSTVSQWVKEGGFSTIMELFAGAGNLTVSLAPHRKKMVTVEISGEACRAAKRNLSKRNLKHVTVVNGDSLKTYLDLGNKYELVVLDPPPFGRWGTG
jgi:23S rRNA (uracil1939-C5)-methyltransferase